MYCKNDDPFNVIANAHPIPLVEETDGKFNFTDLEMLLKYGSYLKIKAICIENTHCAKGGAVLPLDFIAKTKQLAS